MDIKTLKNISVKKITDTFNLSFSDYFIPLHLTPEQLSSKMSADKINLDYSVGIFDNENLIAFILHGTDIIESKSVVYNGGTGVIPEKRGQGLTKQMYDFILPVLKKEGVDYLVLEVISKNIQAIKSYEKVGYKIVRELRCYKGNISEKNKSSHIDIRKLNFYDWKLMESFWDFIPTWQNSSHIIEEGLNNNNKSFGAYIDKLLIGYIIYNPDSKRIQQLAVHKNYRRTKIASTLITKVIKESGRELSIINIDKDSEPINAFLIKTGFENFLNQFEMRLELKY